MHLPVSVMSTDSPPEKMPPPIDAADLEDDEEEDIHPRDLWAIARFLGPFMQPYRRPLLVIACILLAETLINASFPLATQYLIDKGLTEEIDPDGVMVHGKDLNVVIGVLVFLAVATAVITALGVALDYINAKVFTALIMGIRQKLFGHVQSLSMPFFTRTHAGEVLSRFSGDVVSLESTLTTMATWGLVPLLEVVYSVCLLFYFNVWLALIGALVFPLTLLGPRFFASWAYSLSYDKRQREAEVLTAVQENVTAQGVVKAFGLEKQTRARFGILNLLWLAISFRVHFLGALVERSSTTGVYVVHFLSVGLGAYWVYKGELTLGTLVAFETTFLSMGYAMTYVTQYVPMLAQAAGSIHHINDLFAQQPQVEDAPGATALPRLQREIVYDHVSFQYAEDSFAMRDVSVRIAEGSFIAFVGSSGSGKSTMLNLLLRLYDPTAGAIRIDGIDIRAVTQESLRAQIGMVFQDNYLFNTTILENLRMAYPAARMEQIEAAARAAEIHDFISALPAGYNTVVGERGSQLSGGQRQRLAIARALVRDPAILMLDEATSALDYSTEAALNDTLLKVAQNRTVIMVTHRLSSVISAAHIVVLDQGRVVESGTHDELLRQRGAYAALWRNQMERRAADPVADLCDSDPTPIPPDPLVGVMRDGP
jgi:ATP-binding cassette, subfamily B, bacterial